MVTYDSVYSLTLLEVRSTCSRSETEPTTEEKGRDPESQGKAGVRMCPVSFPPELITSSLVVPTLF